MRLTKKRLFQTLCFACVAPLMSQALSKEAVPDPAANIREAVAHVMHAYNLPGMAIAVTDHGRQTFYRSCALETSCSYSACGRAP